MKNFGLKEIVLLGCTLMLVVSGHAQDMLNAWKKAHDQINVSVGLRVGEPTGINFQLYRGVTTGCTKHKGFFDFVVGQEGIIYGTDRSYGNNRWQSGGLRYSVTYFHEVNNKLFGSLLYYGIGAQAGQRRFIENGTEREEFAYGPSCFCMASCLLPLSK
jgi:hypothetical protein